MKILLISVNKEKSVRPVLPLGMVTIATHVKKFNYDIECLDLCFELDPEIAIKNKVKQYKPDVVGISLRNVDSLNYLEPKFYLPEALEAITWCREQKPNCIVVIGGAGFSHAPEQILRYTRADYGIVGPGETSFVILLDKLSKNEPIINIEGIVYITRDNRFYQEPPSFKDKNDQYTPIARELYDRRYYEYTYLAKNSYEHCMETVQTKKGCLQECLYCSNFKIDGKTVNLFNIKQTVDEIEKMQLSSHSKGFEIIDGVFNVPLQHAINICKEMKLRNIRLPWRCMLNIGAVTEELADLMDQTGCVTIDFGTDSCSDIILTRLKKKYSKKQIIDAHRIFEKHERIGITHCVFIGSPGETRDTVRETLELMNELVPNKKDLRHTVYFCLGMRIWEGTKLYDIALDEHVISRSDDLSFPHYYISPSVLRDEVLLDEIEKAVVNNENWYLWWGLPNYSLKDRVCSVQQEYNKMNKLYAEIKQLQTEAPNPRREDNNQVKV